MQKMKRAFSRKRTLALRLGLVALTMALTFGLLSQSAFAQTTYVITDGDKVLVHTTYTTDPVDVLSEAGLELGADDTFVTQTDGEISEITVNRMQLVRVNNGNQALEVPTYGSTVGQVLQQLDIQPGPDMNISLPLDTPTADGMVIDIGYIEYRQEEFIREEPFDTLYCEDVTLESGEEEVVSEGSTGSTLCTALVTYENGVEIDRVITAETILEPAVDAIVARGTDRSLKEQPGEKLLRYGWEDYTDFGQFSSTSARGGNTITTASGEVISYVKKLSVEATAYTCEGYVGTTAIGTVARFGAIAVDPTVIPYGTRMYIVSDDGQYHYGYATAEDCGNFRGNAIDLYFNTEDECWQFGRRACTVYILG